MNTTDVALAQRSTASCAKCATDLPDGARFCGSCGTPVAAVTDVRSRFITVMFCDLSNSTAITESLGDEAMYGVITRYQQVCTDAIAENGGFVAKFMGDGMLAYFGYPEAMKNSAAAAVAAADQILQRVGGITLPDGTALAASAGAATGWVVVGDAQPGTNAAEKMAIGWTVNLASRLQGLAGPGQVVVSEEAGRRLDAGAFALTPLGARDVQGLTAPVDIWLAAPTRSATVAPGFVGRDPLLQTLAAHWDQIAQTGLHVAEIEAPAGYGKTTLARRFLADLPPGTTVLELQGEQHRRDQSFACLRQFVRGLAGLETAMPRTAQQARLTDWAPAASTPGLAHLLGLNDDMVAPLVRREMILQAMVALLVATLPTDPALLLIEDAHWLDADTVAVLQALHGKVATRPLLVLTTRRPTGAGPVMPGARMIELGRMDPPEALGLIDTLDPQGRVSADLRQQIVSQAQGVPLYVQHFTRAMVERPDSAADLAVPLTMIEALHERFDHIGDARPTVEAAAILGTEIRIDVLAALVKRPVDRVSFQMAELIARGLFAPGADGTVIFDHTLIRDAVVDTLLTGQRRDLHARALDAWAKAAPQRFEAAPTIAAYHLMGAGQPAAAIPKLIEAASTGLLRNEIAEGVRLLRKAIAALPDIPAGPTRDGLEMLSMFWLGATLTQHRGFSDPEVVQAYNRALELCLATQGGTEIEFQIAWGIWSHLFVIGDAHNADRIVSEMNIIAADAPALQVLAFAAKSVMQCSQGKFAAQQDSFAKVRQLYDLSQHRLHALTYAMDSLEMAMLFKIHGHYITGDLPGWKAAMADAWAHEADLRLPFLRPYVHVWGNAPHYFADMPADYQSELAQTIAHAGQIGQPFWVVAGLGWLALEKLQTGDLIGGTQDLEIAVAQMTGIGVALSRPILKAHLALCYAKLGRMDEARAMIDRAVAAIDQGRDGMHAAEVYRLQAEVEMLLNPDAVSLAETILDRADQIAIAQDARSWSALIAASRARLMARKIGQERAQVWLTDRLAALVRPDSLAHPAFVTAARAFTKPQ